jgi:hypothetical protein
MKRRLALGAFIVAVALYPLLVRGGVFVFGRAALLSR